MSRTLEKLGKVLAWIKLAGLSGLLLGALIGLVILVGECREWQETHKPKPPEVVPGGPDAGRPVPPEPSQPEAPVLPPTTVPCQDLVVPTLTRADLARLAAKYGMVVLPAERVRMPQDRSGGPTPQPAVNDEQSDQPAALPTHAFPLLLAEERFGPGPAGDEIDASAWLLGSGVTDLRAAWRDYQPPVSPRERFWSLRPAWEVGFILDPTSPSDDWRGWVALEPLRAGTIRLRAEAGFERGPEREDKFRLGIGAVKRWGRQ